MKTSNNKIPKLRISRVEMFDVLQEKHIKCLEEEESSMERTDHILQGRKEVCFNSQ